MAAVVAAEIYWRWQAPFPLPCTNENANPRRTSLCHRSTPVREFAEVLLRLGHLLGEHVVDLRLGEVLLAWHVVDLLHVQVLHMSPILPEQTL